MCDGLRNVDGTIDLELKCRYCDGLRNGDKMSLIMPGFHTVFDSHRGSLRDAAGR